MSGTPVLLGERPVVGPDTEILGGVFLGAYAIVVDFEENGEPYEFAYSCLKNILHDATDASALEVGLAAGEVVRRVMPFSRPKTGNLLLEEAKARGQDRIRPMDEVGLSRFIEGGSGTCQHQALLAGALLRLIQQRQNIEGEISIDWVPSLTDYPFRHTWVRYVKDGEKIILDDSGPMSAIRLAQPLRPADRIYLRPEDLSEFTENEKEESLAC